MGAKAIEFFLCFIFFSNEVHSFTWRLRHNWHPRRQRNLRVISWSMPVEHIQLPRYPNWVAKAIEFFLCFIFFSNEVHSFTHGVYVTIVSYKMRQFDAVLTTMSMSVYVDSLPTLEHLITKVNPNDTWVRPYRDLLYKFRTVLWFLYTTVATINPSLRPLYLHSLFEIDFLL